MIGGPACACTRGVIIKEDALAQFVHSTAFRLSLLALFAGCAVAGILRDDVREVVTNATILCFSCIGLK